MEVLAGLASATVAACAAWLVVPPVPRLGPRVRPYSAQARTTLGRGADPAPVVDPGALLSTATLRRLLEPVVGRLARRVGQLIERGGEERLALRLRQSGLLAAVPLERRVQEYRVRTVGQAALQGMLFGGAALVTGRSSLFVLAAGALGVVSGVSRLRGRVDRAIAVRRERMRIELYTVNQLLALDIRTGGGVTQSLQHLVERGSGAVIGELREVLRLHRSGRPLPEALQAAARTTPEPQAARTYKLLANGAELGVDLAEGLRRLSDDIRSLRAETLKRAATKRRAAMLVPIIAVLAPVMLLFIGAPLPAIVFGAR